MKLIINYMPPEPELDSTVYYINTGYVKSHGDSSEIKDKETGEMRMACSLISNEDLQNNPDITGVYNYEKYLDAFNKRVCYTQKKIGSLLSAFDPEVAKKIPVKVIKKGEKKGELQKEMFTRDQLELKSFDLDYVDEAMYLEKKEVDFWNKTGYDPRLVWDGFKMYDDYKVHYEIYENALNFLNDKMKETGKPAIKSINDKYEKGDLVLIKDGSEYHVGAFNGVYIQIVRDNVKVPKSDLELELDRLREEKQKKTENLESGELGSKTDREIYLEGQQEKRERYFKEFGQAFGIDATMTMEDLFSALPEAKDAFETFIITNDNAAEEAASEYLDVDGGSY
jgi:hypothetical protein